MRKSKTFDFMIFAIARKHVWARKGIPADAAMLAAGHNCVHMHNRYINLKPVDVAKAFGIVQIVLRVLPDSPAK